MIPSLCMLPSGPATIPLAAVAARFATRPFERMRQVRGVLSDRPRTPHSIAIALGLPCDTVRRALGPLVEVRLALRIGRGRYVRRDTARPVLADAQVRPEVGRQILACLTEPRRVVEIARDICRSGTGHLRHLAQPGLVVRLERGVYALAGRVPGRGVTEPGGPLPAAG